MDNFLKTGIESDKFFHRTSIGIAAAAVVFIIFALQTSQVWFLYCLVMKLVRDLIPQIIEESGKSCEYHIADLSEYGDFLYKKMHEEMNEFFEDPSYEEAADMYEVLSAICYLHEMNMELVVSAAADKCKARGGFADRVILEKVTNESR